MKAYFLQRLISYLIDFFIVIFIVTGITFFIPTSDTYKEAYKEANEISDLYFNGEISNSEYLSRYGDVSYTMAKETIVVTVINLVVTIAYFGSYSYYMNGQTIGKKIMKIRVVNKDNSNVGHGILIFRTAVIYGVIESIISLIILQLISSDMYLYAITPLEILQYIFVLISLFMIMFRKDGRGLHDILFKTKVISLK